MNEIQPIIDWVQANLPWADEALMFIGFARLLAKPISAWLQGLFSKLLAFVERTPETDDDEWLRRVLASVPYRVLSFVVDLLLSVKLPTSETVTKAAAASPIPVPLVLLVGLLGLGLTACAPLNERVEAGGAYHAGDVVQGELYALDASFDLAYSGLDGIFKHEQANRQVLWNINPNIKRSLDKIRREAGIAKRDYAVAREAYLKQPAIGLGELNAALGKLNAANAAALEVIKQKGIQ